MKILITGSKGFIARNLTEQLKENYEITAFDSKQLNLLDFSAVNCCLKKYRFDAVIHTATYDAAPEHSQKNPAKVLENNLRMFFNLIKEHNFFGKMIYFGSGAEFNRENWVPKMKENYFDMHIPSDQYGFSKYIMTKQALLMDNIYNLRLFAVFGKYDDWRVRPVSSFCHDAAFGRPLKLKKNKLYDLMYVEDLTHIVDWFIMNKPRQKVYNICTGRTEDFKLLAKEVIELSGKDLELKIEEDGFGQEYSGDNSLLLNELKDFKFTPTFIGMKNLYEWYEQNIGEQNE